MYGDYSNPSGNDFTAVRKPYSVDPAGYFTGAGLAALAADGSGNIIDGSTSAKYNWDVTQTHVADLSDATSASINELRRAFRLQEWLERNARGGSRYIEVIMAHFGVKSSDSRLQRPEFLGGSATPVTISEVLQTSDNASETTPQRS